MLNHIGEEGIGECNHMERKSLRKRIHIPAVFVNFSEFGGDSSNTITNYSL